MAVDGSVMLLIDASSTSKVIILNDEASDDISDNISRLFTSGREW